MLPGADDEVEGAGIDEREFVLKVAEGLADGALDAVAFDGVADGFGDREAQARVGEGVGLGEDDEWAAGFGDAGVEDGPELEGVGEAVACAEREPRGRHEGW